MSMRDWNKRKKQVNKKRRLFLLLLTCLLTLAAGAGVGSVAISPADILAILGNRLFSLPLPEDISPNQVSILWTLRLPRCLCAFLVGRRAGSQRYGDAVRAEESPGEQLHARSFLRRFSGSRDRDRDPALRFLLPAF